MDVVILVQYMFCVFEVVQYEFRTCKAFKIRTSGKNLTFLALIMSNE